MRFESSTESHVSGVRERHFDYFLSLIVKAQAPLDVRRRAWAMRRLGSRGRQCGVGPGMGPRHTPGRSRVASGRPPCAPHRAARPHHARSACSDPGRWASPGTRHRRWSTRARAKALRVAGRCAADKLDFETAREWFGEALTLDEHLGDARCEEQPACGAWETCDSCPQSREVLRTSNAASASAEGSATNPVSRGPPTVWPRSRSSEAEISTARSRGSRRRRRNSNDSASQPARLGVISCRATHGDSAQNGMHALAHFARALSLQERTRDVALGGRLLDGVAGVAAALREAAPTAATLLGAGGDSWRDLHSLHLIPMAQPVHHRDVARARRQLGPDAFAAAYLAGRRLTPGGHADGTSPGRSRPRLRPERATSRTDLSGAGGARPRRRRIEQR